MNKLQKLIVWLFRIPITKERKINIINPEFKLPTEVIRVEDSDNDIEFITELGITKERYTELCKLADTQNGELVTDCLIKISKECKHPNELAVMSYMLGRSIEYYSNPFNHLIQIKK